MQDAESGEQRVFDIKHNGNELSDHRENLQQEMLESGVNLINLEVGADCVEALTGFFHARQRRAIDETGG